MCGITGFLGQGTTTDLNAMAATLVHRGPDDEGLFSDAGVHLACRRLAVTDPAGGAQPMWDDAGSLCVLFNGQIYNHRALRRTLEGLGHRFRSSHSDTEVILEGFKAWGMGLFARLNGMFAVVLYDRARRKILIARDRFGEKPMFYAAHPHAFVFGSELPALLKHPALHAWTVSKMGLMKFFAHGFFPGTHTPYEGIYKVPAGHVITIDTVTRVWEMQAYWKFEIVPDAPPPGTVGDWATEIEFLLKKSVAARLECDVPAGIFLSGGLDSSAVLSFGAQARDAASLKTFTLGFTEASYDEARFAEEVARHIGSSHHVATFQEDIPFPGETLASFGEPIGDSSILPTHRLARFAREHVTVALTGDGGDELFAGYDPFQALAPAAAYDRLVPAGVHAVVRSLASYLPCRVANMSLEFIMNRTLRGLKQPAALRNPLWLAPLLPDEVAELFAAPVSAEELYSEAIAAWEACPSTHPVDRSLDFYTRFYLTDGILVKTDRAAMRVSLETRAPFLDHDLVDYVRRLPWRVKLSGNAVSGYQTKALLRNILRGRLPPHIVARRKKGFGMPVARLLRQWPPPSRPTHFMVAAKMQRRWREHAAARRDDRLALWCWLASSAAA